MIYSRNCPKCNKETFHKTENALYQANWSERLCKKCSQIGHVVSDASKKKMSLIKIGKPTWSSLHREEMSKKIRGKNHPFYGKHHTEEMRKRQSERYKGRKLFESTKEKLKASNKVSWQKPEIRKKYNDALSKTMWIKVRSDVGQIELLNKWNRLGFNFEPNFQIKTEQDLFYVDGYDPHLKVVLEYDSKYHNKHKQSQLDMLRQEKIIKSLNPKRFWRFNSSKGIFIECITKTTSGL